MAPHRLIAMPLISAAGKSILRPTPEYGTARTVTVATASSDSLRGEALLAAYATAKAFPGLSEARRALVLIPDGGYKLTETMVLDTDFVDLAAVTPTVPEGIGDDDLFYEVDQLEDATPTDTYSRPQPVEIYADWTSFTDVVQQTCSDIRLTGFTIASYGVMSWNNDKPTTNIRCFGAFSLMNVDNSPSRYDRMKFWAKTATNGYFGSTATYKDFRGTWTRCVGGSHSFTIGKGMWDDDFDPHTDITSARFSARMIDCQGGPQSFIADQVEDEAVDSKASGAIFIRCSCRGSYAVDRPGDETYGFGTSGFGGCGIVGTIIDDTCYFEDCTAGRYSFGLGHDCSGTFVRCVGGRDSFGAGLGFLGIATDCSAGQASFGGYEDGWLNPSYCSGTLTRCTITGNTRPLNLAGATLVDCEITNTTADQDCVNLLDSDSVITGTTLLVVAGGTGYPVNAATAKSVSISDSVMNNAANSATGLGPNVTNTATTPNNTVTA